MINKREQLRQAVNAPVMLSHSVFGEIKANTQDISNSGVFILIAEQPILPIGSHIKLQFIRSVYPDVSFNTRVVRATKKGIGLVLIDYEYEEKHFPIQDLKYIWEQNA